MRPQFILKLLLALALFVCWSALLFQGFHGNPDKAREAFHVQATDAEYLRK